MTFGFGHFSIPRGMASALLVFLLIISPAYADKVKDIQQALEKKKAEQAALTQKAASLSSEVSNLKNGLVGLSKNLRQSEEKLSETDQELQDLKEKKAIYNSELKTKQKAMDELLAAARRHSKTTAPQKWMESDPINSKRAAMVMKTILPAIHQQSEALEKQLAEIKKIESDIAEKLATQAKENNKINTEKEKLQVLLNERKKLYQNTEAQRQEQEKEVAALAKEAKNLEDLMQKIKEKNKSASKAAPSKMILPVHGTIRTSFGEKDDLGAESKGMTFITRSNASVTVPIAGTVKFAGPFQNYKQILIVEHQGGYHSLIGGLARIDTVVGASLVAGEPVGVAAAIDSPRIYYELRQNGKPVNPQKLLITQKKTGKNLNHAQ